MGRFDEGSGGKCGEQRGDRDRADFRATVLPRGPHIP